VSIEDRLGPMLVLPIGAHDERVVGVLMPQSTRRIAKADSPGDAI
jgi:hypothetical protein